MKYSLIEIYDDMNIDCINIQSSDKYLCDNIAQEVEKKFTVKKKEFIFADSFYRIFLKADNYAGKSPTIPGLQFIKDYLVNEGWEPFSVLPNLRYCFKKVYQ